MPGYDVDFGMDGAGDMFINLVTESEMKKRLTLRYQLHGTVMVLPRTGDDIGLEDNQQIEA